MLNKETSVLRDEKWIQLEIKELTFGDIVKLHSGDVVPADCRLVQMNSLSLMINQSLLNGESSPCGKLPKREANENSDIYKQINMLYKGTEVLFGNCLAVVT